MIYGNQYSSIKPKEEKQAILDFLRTYWDITTAHGDMLSIAVEYVLQKGITYGINWQENKLEKIINTYSDFKITEKDEKLKGFKPRKEDEPEPEFDFAKEVEIMAKSLKKDWGMRAQPKDYQAFKKAYNEDREIKPEILEFGRTKLHHSIEYEGFPFETLSKENILYNDEKQDKEPLTELVSAVYKQGMNLGVLAVEERYGSTKEILSRINKILETK